MLPSGAEWAALPSARGHYTAGRQSVRCGPEDGRWCAAVRRGGPFQGRRPYPLGIAPGLPAATIVPCPVPRAPA